ncbi:phage tail tape measure protein [Comamonas aquatica]|uniref:phage tail tape measure protein n=1 Tax=Comamonas aquatica TaxID=225991 RepID=UPI00244A9D64|nr:phage tail tape measure protein [Comamonas aquatica]MDH1815368.1 phage tail tape measure protein [Comamonas aquatica]
MAFKPIQIVINAKDNASAVLGRLEGNIKAVGIAVAGYFGIKAFAGGIQGAAEFEAAMSRVKAATDGTAEEMTALTKAAQGAGTSTKYTSVEAAGALENLAKAGLSAGDSIKALPAVLALAQAGEVELATASEYVTKAVMGMGLAFDDAGRVADVLAKGANATNTSVEGLAQALSYAAPVANSLGVSLESTVAMVGKLADAGIDASRAGTALNSIMSQFANPASKFRQELGAAGIVTTDFDKALRQLAASGQAGEKAINAVGMEAGPGLRALLNQGMGALDGLTDSLRNAQGSAEAVARTMADNLQGSLTGLGSVWDAVVTALNTPVLPVLKQGVDALAGSLRRLVDDGSVTRMGQVLATAFDNGIQGVQKFLGALDVNQIILRMQVMASEVGEAFQRITTFATNAGNAVRMAWGVMSAGASGVMAVIYKVGEAFAGVASNIQSGVALIMDGLSRITFGGVSASFKQAAEEIRLSAEATWASSQALAAKADESFNAMAEGAELARDGWDGLTQAADPAVGAAQKMAAALGEVTQAQEAQAQASQALLKQQEQKAKSDEAARAAVNALRTEYDSFVKEGNLQAAAQKLLEIDRAQQALSKSGAQATDAAALLEQAYKDLGLKTNQELQEAADKARAAFETLAKDGTQAPQRIAEAWEVMAQRAIDANAGVAPSWLKVEAAVKGYEIAVSNAGKSVVSTEEATLKATGRMAQGYAALGNAAEGAERRMQRAGKVPMPDNKKPGDRDVGAERRPSPVRKPDPDFNGLELKPEDAERIKELQDSGDHLVAASELRKIKWQQELEASRKATEQRSAENAERSLAALDKVKDLKTGGSDRDLLNEMFGHKPGGGSPLQSAFPKGAITFQMPTAPLVNAGQAVPAMGVGSPAAAAVPSPAQVFRHEFVLPSGNLGVNVADQDSSDAMQQLFEQLERGAQMSGGVR